MTAQHDRQFVYGRRRMPYRKRRRWGRFVRKVGAVSLKQCGLRTVVFNKASFFSNNLPQQHGVGSVALYSQTSTVTDMNDLNYIGNMENFAANPTSAAGETVQLGTKIYFRSAILDVTIRNTSFTSITNVIEVPLEVDLYQITFATVGRDSVAGAYVNTKAFYDVATADTQIIKGTAGFDVDIDKRGCTPFDVPLASSRFKAKILTKRKYFVPPGGTITYQLRDPKNRATIIQELREREGCNRAGWTKHLLIIFKAPPGYTVGTLANEVQERIDVGITRKYSYKIEGLNEPRSWHEAR